MTETSVFYNKYYKPMFINVQKYIPSSIHPNVLTITNFVIINMLYYFKFYENPYYLSFGMISYFFLDNLDGVHARATKKTSKLGEILDHCTDGYLFPLLIIIFSTKYIKDVFIQKILLLLLLGCFNIKHLLHKYSNKLSLGFKYFSIDEISLLCAIIPLIYIPDNIINYVVYSLILGSTICILSDIKKIRLFKIKSCDLLSYIFVSLLPLYNNNIYILCIITSLYVLQLIKSS